MYLELSQEPRCSEHEHAAVPQVAATADVVLRGGSIRLLPKLLNGANAFGEAVTEPDVAVADLGPRWVDPERQEVSLFGEAGGEFDGLAECLLVPDHVIGGHDEHDGIGAIGRELERCHGGRRSRVPPDGFEDESGVGMA